MSSGKIWLAIKRFYIECLRVLKVTKKPTNFEFKTIVKVTSLGMVIIGFVGFVIVMFKQLFIG